MSTLRAMADATAPLVGAIEAVAAGHDLAPTDVDALLPTLREAPPTAYPLAGTDDVDVAAIADVLRRHPRVLTADTDGDVSVDVDDCQTDPRGVSRAARAARAVVDAAVLALEARKLAFGLMAKPAALKAVWASPDDARATLLAVRGLEGRVGVTASSVSPPSWSPALPPDREVHVVAGAGARRVLDVLAPSVRRLRVELALAGRRGAVVDDDDVYRGLVRLHGSDPSTVVERRTADAAEGVIEVDDGAGFVVDAAALVEELVDRRARGLVLPLKRARIAIVGVVDPDDLGRVLAALASDHATVRSLQLLVPATIVDDVSGEDPGAVVDAASRHVWPGTASTATLSLPWLGLAPPGVPADAGAFALLQAAAAARLDGALTVTPGLRRFSDDESAAALAALAAMAPVPSR